MSRYDDELWALQHVYDHTTGTWIKRGTREHYDWMREQGRQGEIDRYCEALYRDGMDGLRAQAIAEGVRSEAGFQNWLDMPAVVTAEVIHLPVDDATDRTFASRRSISRRDHLFRQVQATKHTMMEGEATDLRPIERKSAPLWSLKMDSRGVIKGYLSTFGNVDLTGDVVVKGAFEKCLSRNRRNRKVTPVLWMHDPAKPIGKFVSLEEDGHGLAAVAQLDLTIEDGKRAFSGIKQGYIGGMSIGYHVDESDVDRNGHRLLKAVSLMEGSVVTFPANEQAVIISAE